MSTLYTALHERIEDFLLMATDGGRPTTLQRLASMRKLSIVPQGMTCGPQPSIVAGLSAKAYRY